MDIDRLHDEYLALAPTAEQFAKAAFDQITELVSERNIPLAVPIEQRIKSWTSIDEKIRRKSLDLEELTKLQDLIGLRLILLFRRDLEKVHGLINERFYVLSHEDTAERLDAEQFGYQSRHYIINLPSMPSYSGTLKVEIQTRTLAQHMWAVGSHKLQYKQEQSVPKPVRRSINRVSALLEIVDLEFERVLEEREQYLKDVDARDPDLPLNVDLISRMLDELLPAKNKGPDEYASLLVDLLHFHVDTSSKLRSLINDYREAIDDEEAAYVRRKAGPPNRVDQGVYFSHSGLVRIAMNAKFGNSWDEWQVKRELQDWSRFSSPIQ